MPHVNPEKSKSPNVEKDPSPRPFQSNPDFWLSVHLLSQLEGFGKYLFVSQENYPQWSVSDTRRNRAAKKGIPTVALVC